MLQLLRIVTIDGKLYMLIRDGGRTIWREVVPPEPWEVNEILRQTGTREWKEDKI